MKGIITVLNLLTDKTGTGAGSSFSPRGAKETVHCFGSTSAGAGAVTVDVEVSNDGTTWVVAATIDLTLSTSVAADGFVFNAPWKFMRGNVTAISGTDAKVSLVVGNSPGTL